MRNQYMTRKYVRKRMKEILDLCSDQMMKKFIENRIKEIENSTTTVCRKYLYYDTIEKLQNPYRWQNPDKIISNRSEPRIFI